MLRDVYIQDRYESVMLSQIGRTVLLDFMDGKMSDEISLDQALQDDQYPPEPMASTQNGVWLWHNFFWLICNSLEMSNKYWLMYIVFHMLGYLMTVFSSNVDGQTVTWYAHGVAATLRRQGYVDINTNCEHNS